MNRRSLFTRIRDQRGQAAVEFALVVPVLIALLLGILQCGIAFSHYLTVTDAARAGARKAILLRVSNVTPGDVADAVRSAAPDLNSTDLGITVGDASDPSFSKGGSTVTVTVTYPYSINVLGWVVSSGNLTSTMTDRLE
jgi:Flp pilus assembly protein TadG